MLVWKDIICTDRQNGLNCCWDVAIYHILSRWQPNAISDLWGTLWDDPWRVFGGLYHCAKCCWNLWGMYIILKFKYFVHLTTPLILSFFFGGGGGFDPVNGKQYQCNSEKAHPCMKDIIQLHSAIRNTLSSLTKYFAQVITQKFHANITFQL